MITSLEGELLATYPLIGKRFFWKGFQKQLGAPAQIELDINRRAADIEFPKALNERPVYLFCCAMVVARDLIGQQTVQVMRKNRHSDVSFAIVSTKNKPYSLKGLENKGF